MEQINSTNPSHFIILNKSFTNDIIINTYDNKSFEGTCVILNKEQAKELVNKLNLLIYGGAIND